VAASEERREPHPDDEATRLWRRLCDRDPIAPSDFALHFFEPLCAWLGQRYPANSEHDRVTAAGDAILELIQRPAAYQPERQTLEVYLHIAASADLKNLIRAEDRHARRRVGIETVELSRAAGKYLVDETADPAARVEREEDAAERESLLTLDGLTPEEEQVLVLLRRGERRTAVYAAALGILDRPVAVQTREVKRVKDRLKKRLERGPARRG